MSDAPETPAEKLRRQIAAAESRLEAMREKLARAIAAQGEPVARTLTGLDQLWAITPTLGRNRSTKQQCRAAWAKIPAAERPTIAELLAAMKAWAASDDWKKDGGTFVPALHRWIKNRAWESIPESAPAPSRYRTLPKPAPAQPAGDGVTDPAEIARLLTIDIAGIADSRSADPCRKSSPVQDTDPGHGVHYL
jgi:hypothetical protein